MTPTRVTTTGTAMLLILVIVLDRGHFVSTSLPPFFFPTERCNSNAHIHLFGINNLRIILFSQNCTLNCTITIHDSKIDSLVELSWLELILQGPDPVTGECRGGYIEVFSMGTQIAQKLCSPFPIMNLHLTELTITVVLDGTAVVSPGGCYVVLQYKRVGHVKPTEAPGRNFTGPTDPGKIVGIVAGVLVGCILVPALIYAVYACMPRAIARPPPMNWLPFRPRPIPRPITRPMRIPRPRPRPQRRLRYRTRRHVHSEPSISPESTISSASTRYIPALMPVQKQLLWQARQVPKIPEEDEPYMPQVEPVYDPPEEEYPPEEEVQEAMMSFDSQSQATI